MQSSQIMLEPVFILIWSELELPGTGLDWLEMV